MSRHFLSTEVWAPAWTVCEREDLAPDVFLSLANESFGGGVRKGLLFNSVAILAVVSELAQRHATELDIAVSALQEATGAKLVGYKRRPWGKSCGSDSFTNAIQDLAYSGLFKPGPRHEDKLGLHLFADKWKSV